jgi:penicillin-binding protein 2
VAAAAFAAIVAISLAALVARLVQVQLFDGGSYRARALANQIRLIPVAAPRGIIADRHGTILARSRPFVRRCADSIGGRTTLMAS